MPAAAGGLAYSPSGAKLAVIVDDNRIRVFQEDDTALLQEFRFDSKITSLAFPFESQFVVGTSGGQTLVQSIALTNMVQAHSRAVTSVLVSPGGKRLVTVGADAPLICLWDCDNLKTPVAKFGGVEGGILQVVACASGQYLAAACNDPKHSVLLWSTTVAGDISKPIDPVARLAHSDPVTTLSLTADGKYLIAGGEGEDIHLWDTDSKKQIARLRKTKTAVRRLAINERDRTILAMMADQTVQVWTLPKGGGNGAQAIVASGPKHGAIHLPGTAGDADKTDAGTSKINLLDNRVATLETAVREARTSEQRDALRTQWLQARTERQKDKLGSPAPTLLDSATPQTSSLDVLQRQEAETVGALKRMQALEAKLDRSRTSEEKATVGAELASSRQDYFRNSTAFLPPPAAPRRRPPMRPAMPTRSWNSAAISNSTRPCFAPWGSQPPGSGLPPRVRPKNSPWKDWPWASSPACRASCSSGTFTCNSSCGPGT